MNKIKIDKKESLFGEFNILRNRAGMICGGKDIRLLIGYINGRKSCSEKFERKSGVNWNEVVLYNDFENYIETKYKGQFGDNNITYKILLSKTNNDGLKAFELFFELFDDFMKEKGFIFKFD